MASYRGFKPLPPDVFYAVPPSLSHSRYCYESLSSPSQQAPPLGSQQENALEPYGHENGLVSYIGPTNDWPGLEGGRVHGDGHLREHGHGHGHGGLSLTSGPALMGTDGSFRGRDSPGEL